MRAVDAAQHQAVEAFVERVTLRTADQLDRRRAVFAAVQAFKYATDSAYDAASLLQTGAGNCVAKALLLRHSFALLGVEARLARWKYRLEDPFVHLLGVAEDVHTAVQARVGGTWRMLDATHDAQLPTPPFVVASWDGVSDTKFAYPPTSEVWIDGLDDADIAAAIDGVVEHLNGRDTHEYTRAFNTWLRASRARSIASNELVSIESPIAGASDFDPMRTRDERT